MMKLPQLSHPTKFLLSVLGLYSLLFWILYLLIHHCPT